MREMDGEVTCGRPQPHPSPSRCLPSLSTQLPFCILEFRTITTPVKCLKETSINFNNKTIALLYKCTISGGKGICICTCEHEYRLNSTRVYFILVFEQYEYGCICISIVPMGSYSYFNTYKGCDSILILIFQMQQYLYFTGTNPVF